MITVICYSEDGAEDCRGTLAEWLDANAEDEETTEELLALKPGSEVWLGGGAQPRTRLVAVEG